MAWELKCLAFKHFKFETVVLKNSFKIEVLETETDYQQNYTDYEK